MQSILKTWAETLLDWIGATSAQHASWDRWVAVALVVAAVLLFDYLARKAVIFVVRRAVERTRAAWDDELFSVDVLGRGCHVVGAVLLGIVVPILFEPHTEMRTIVARLVQSYLILTIFRFVNALLRAAFRIVSARPAWRNKPIKGLRQTAQGIAALVCAVIIVSILLDKSPAVFLTGLSASAAVVLLIFRDSILGFVSGIQLSANDMLQVGDWITMPRYGADGTVVEVTLTTVKVRNWDNTIVTLPPYVLVSDSFQNWQAMRCSGGRRVMRSVAIDMSSVGFCAPELAERFAPLPAVRDYLARTERSAAAYRAASSAGVAAPPRPTNLGLFRAYVLHYLTAAVQSNGEMTTMVRQLQPTEHGLPLQLYFFTDTVDWIAYETIQSEVFEHVLSVAREFGLRVFQSPSGDDVAALRGAAGRASERPAPEASAEL